MHWPKRIPLLGAVLVLWVGALATEAWLLQQVRQQATRAVAELEQKQQERDWLARQSPALSETTEQAIARDLAQAGQMFAALRTALLPRESKLSATPPTKSIDAYFDLATFVERTRALAARAQVGIKPEERFGFASLANEGPAEELVAAVFRQRVTAQRLIEALLEARPHGLLGVQRERPMTAEQRARRNDLGLASPPATITRMEGGATADFFDSDDALSLRVPGRVECEAIRLEFSGQTPALRAFLNNLAAMTRPMIVRRIEVEPMAVEASEAGLPVPLVARAISKFSVEVEDIELLPAPERSTP